jgi:hypothetical protein
MNLLTVIPKTIVNDQFLVRNLGVLELLKNVKQDETFCNFNDLFEVQDANIDLQQTAFLQVVTETVFDYPHRWLSEKTWKTIISLRPFILVSVPGALNDLKNFGFQTFDQWWDESYDSIEDPVDRLLAITDIIETITEKPKKELVGMLHEIEPILKHNYNHYYTEFRSYWINQIHTQCQRNLLPR